MIALNVLPQFEEDALDIWTHVVGDSVRAADALLDRLHERCLVLRDHPGAGPARPDIAADCRQLVAGPVLVLYRWHGDRVDLVRAIYRGRAITPGMFSPD